MDGDSSHIEDVTDNIERIYSELARPLQKLENVGEGMNSNNI